MDMQEPQMDYEQEEYQSTSFSSDTDLFSQLLLATSDEKFVETIIKIKSDNEKYLSVMNSFKQYNQKKKASTHFKKIKSRVTQLLINLKQNDRYAQTESQKAVFWFLKRFFMNDSIDQNEEISKALRKISSEFTSFQDFLFFAQYLSHARLVFKKNLFNSEKLYYLYHQQYDKLQNENTKMKFGQTMKTLDEEKKLIIKVEILELLSLDISHWRIDSSEIQNFIDVLSQKPYSKLLECIISKMNKITKNFKTSILKSKIEVKDGMSQIVFAPKCEIHNDLKTKETFQLTAKKSDGSELIPQIDAESLLVHGDYLYTKWSQDVLINAKEKVSFESSAQNINEGFLKFLSFFKKIFEHRNKHIQFLGAEPKMIQQGSQQTTSKETVEYICHSLQLLVKYLSFNSIEINHREQNLGEMIPTSFLEELLKFYEVQLQNAIALVENETENKDEKQPKNIVIQSIDYLVTLAAHLFYRRDFQTITAITSKISQHLLTILLLLPNFPFRWAVLRNYKLVIDRWSESVPEGSEDYRLLAKKFLESYFNSKVTVISKSSSTVFNPIFLTRAYCKILGGELLKFVETVQKQLDECAVQNQSNVVVTGMNSKISKIILFMSTRVRYSETNKIAEHLSNIYRKYAHIVPEIYMFRSWISQLNLTKCSQGQTLIRLNDYMKVITMVSQKTQNLSAKDLLTPKCNLNQEQFSQIIELFNLYKLSHFKALNPLEIKPKTEQLGQQVLHALMDVTKKHIEIFNLIYNKTRQFQSLQKETHDLLKEENQLHSRSGNSSISFTIQQTKKNIMALVRYYICNADKILSTKDYSSIVGAIGAWVRTFVLQNEKEKEKEKNDEKISYILKNLNILVGNKLPFGFNCHLMKNQILGAARALNGAQQMGLKKNEATPFNQVIAFYEQIKPVYSQFIKILIEAKTVENTKKKSELQLNQACNQILEYSIFPNTSIAGPCYFNGKLENKSTQNMVLAVFLEQSQILSKKFNIDEYLRLNEKFSLTNMLKITQDKQSKITQQKVVRPNQEGIFGGLRSNRDRSLVRNELMEYGYTEDQIQIALENVEVPDAQLASQWIQNNQQMIYNLLVEKAIKQSKQETIMKQKVEPKIQIGRITPIEYSSFKDKLKQSMDQLVKTLWRQLFDHDIQKGKKMTDLVFIIIDAFKDRYKSNQYLNFSKKMFSQIDAIKQQSKQPSYKFNDKKYRLILYILNFTLKRQPQVFKNYFKDKDVVCIKVLEFVNFFGQNISNEEQQKKQRSEDYNQLIQIVNKTLPEWKSPLQQVKPELVSYLICLLDLIKISKLGNKDVWQILYKISSLQLPQLRQKIIILFSNIILSKKILEEERQKINAQNKITQKQKKNIFYKAPKKSLPSRTFMLPLIKILLEQDKQLLASNIQLEIKGYIAEQYKYQFKQKSKMEEGKKLPLQIDLKKFSGSFEKFNGCAEFQKVFKKLFTKKKNKKNTIFYDFIKHPFYLNELGNENNHESFVCLKFNPLVEQVLQTLISRVLQFGEQEREFHEQSLINLYKFLDHFKVLIPTALRTQFISPKTNKLTTLLEYLVCDTVALNEKKYHLMTFLSMKNHFIINQEQSISDWVCNEYNTIFRREIESFAQNLGEKRQKQMTQNNQSDNEFKEQPSEQIRFKKVMFNFMYLLQVNTFNSQCFLKTVHSQSIKDQIERLFIHLTPSQQPILYTLISEIIFILRKRQMIQLLKDKYEVHSPSISSDQNHPANLNRSQFLNMSLIYSVQPVNIGEDFGAFRSSSRRRNIFSGSSGRIIVDQLQDQQEDDDGINLDEMEAHGNFDDEIGDLAGLRARQRDQRNARTDVNGESFLYPSESYRLANQPVANQPITNIVSDQQQFGDIVENQIHQEKTEKVQQKISTQIVKQAQKPMSAFDYAKNLEQQSENLVFTLKIVESLMPKLRSIELKSISQQKIQQISESKMVSEEQDKIIQGLSEFLESLSILNNKVKENTSLILPPNTRFDPNSDLNPEFFCRLSLKEHLPKVTRFDKRFKSMIMTLCPQVKINVWQNDHSISSKYSTNQIVRQIPNARWLLSRLEREDNRENRDRMLHSIQNIFNIGREQRRQEDTRPRVLNLNEAVLALPEQPQPPKQEEKPKSEEKQPQKQKSQEKVQIKPEQIQVEQNKIEQLPIQQKIVQQKPQQKKQEKMQEQKPVVESQQKEEEKPITNENQMNIEEQKPALIEPIIPQQPLIQQPVADIRPPQQVMAETGPYREILTIFGLSQTFLADNGIDLESFDSLPQEVQIDQITHYMNQAQNRININQLNQANQPVQQNANQQQQPGQNQNAQQGQQNQGGNAVNDVLQQNIALFASMDPQTRMEMLADYPPEFLMQLPVQMRTQVQQFRQRQLHRFASSQQEENQFGLRQALINPANRRKEKNVKDLKKDDVKYPSPEELKFNPIEDSLAQHLTKSIFLKVEKTPMTNGFRFLLQNYLTQQRALATIISILNIQDGLKTYQLERQAEQDDKKNSQKSQKSIEIPKKGIWKYESLVLNDVQKVNNIKQTLLNLVLDTLNQSIYKNPDFLMKKVPFQNYLHLNIEPQKELQADENGFWPLYELLPYSLSLCPKLSVEILKRVKSLPLKLIKSIVQSIRSDKLPAEIYKNLELLSKNENMKKLFMEEFPEERPLKLETFAKIIKYEFGRVPYLKKLHEEALNYYNAEYNEFLNQIFGIYTIEDIKQIEPILIKHKNVHFQVIKYLYSQNRVLDKEPMGLILKMPHLLDFETKKYLFRKHPKIRRTSRYRLPIEVSRTNILQQSFNQIMSKTPKQLEGRLQVTFMDEQGYDAGGLTRQWLLCLSREIFNPNYALFEPSSSGNTYQPNPKSYINPDHLQYFKFIGRFVGKALSENELVDAYFTRAFYKMVLGQQIELSDLEQQDYSFYKSMLWLKQNKIEEGDYTFSYLYDNFGQRIVKDLISGGRDINVNEENKLEYIEKYCLAKMRDDFKVQIEKFLQGFHQIVPHECINFFEAKQLELLISGLPEISFEDLKNNVDYSGYAPNDQAIKWLWQILEEFTQQDLARLIQFITGTSKIPVDGFANLKGMNGPQRISIHKDPNSHQLPKAHTCFNQLDLPNYDTKQLMREKVVTAITWGSEGFGFM